MPDAFGKPLHLEGNEPAIGGTGLHAAYRHLLGVTGKTIAQIRLGEVPSDAEHTHQGEYLIFEFTDGTALELVTGSNAFRLMIGRSDFNASDLECHFVVLLQADGQTEH